VSPQSSLFDFEAGGLRDLSELTDAERNVYIAVKREEKAVRQVPRETNRRPGPVSDLLKRARLRLDDRDEEVPDTW
jgi:hypothetical protein